MLVTFDQDQLAAAGPRDLSDALEDGAIVFFPRAPLPLPSDQDLEFFRVELPKLLKLKNISYHPEAGDVSGLDAADKATTERVRRVLTRVSDDIGTFLQNRMPGLTRGWTVGTCSFRPIQEKGRNLKPHASNELVHVDAGAYGATNGDRILRFFINVNPSEDRVWASKGAFPELYRRYGDAPGVRLAKPPARHLQKGPLDHLRTGMLKGVAALGLPKARVLDSSPYDRAMRRFHNFMKDTPAFQQDPQGHEDFRFPPFSAWMVFTDMVSHASVSGQHAIVHTSIVRLSSCAKPELAPYNILRQPAAAA